LNPDCNDGRALLYYTGLTRLAKDILQQVVGHYLDRNRATLRALRAIHEEAGLAAEAIQRRDLKGLGRSIGRAWELNKRLDPGSTNDAVEALMARVEPRATGAKLLGAGGGGFLLIICPGPKEAGELRGELSANPPNELARFYEFQVSETGLEVTVN
jgi:galactokinase/mevalonate kinase-like predicted kinase